MSSFKLTWYYQPTYSRTLVTQGEVDLTLKNQLIDQKICQSIDSEKLQNKAVAFTREYSTSKP